MRAKHFKLSRPAHRHTPSERIDSVAHSHPNVEPDQDALSRFLAALQEFHWIMVGNDSDGITTVIDAILQFSMPPLLGGEIWDAVIQTEFLDCLSFEAPTEDNTRLLGLLLPTLCQLFRLGDRENVGGNLLRKLPIAPFIASLLLFSTCFDDVDNSILWYYCLFGNIARLWDSAIGQVFDCILTVAIAQPQVLGDGPLVESAIGQIQSTHEQWDGVSPVRVEASDTLLDGFTRLTGNPFTHDGLDFSLSEILMSGLELLCRHYPQHCLALLECDVMALVVLFQEREHQAAVNHLLASLRELVISVDAGTLPGTWGLLEQLRTAVGSNSIGYVLDMYRVIMRTVPERYPEFRSPEFVDWLLEEMAHGTFQFRRKAAKLLLAFLTQMGDLGDTEPIPHLFLQSAEVLLEFLDLPPEAGLIALRIFEWFDEHRGLEPSQEPDCRFFAWLMELPWDHEEIALSGMDDHIQAWQRRCDDEFLQEML
jgi:hypothetical protein